MLNSTEISKCEVWRPLSQHVDIRPATVTKGSRRFRGFAFRSRRLTGHEFAPMPHHLQGLETHLECWNKAAQTSFQNMWKNSHVALKHTEKKWKTAIYFSTKRYGIQYSEKWFSNKARNEDSQMLVSLRRFLAFASYECEPFFFPNHSPWVLIFIKLDFPPLDYRAAKLQTKLFKTSHFQFATTCGKKVKKKLLTINSFHEATRMLDVASPSGLPFKRSFSRLTLCCNAWQTGLTIKPRDTGFPSALGQMDTLTLKTTQCPAWPVVWHDECTRAKCISCISGYFWQSLSWYLNASPWLHEAAWSPQAKWYKTQASARNPAPRSAITFCSRPSMAQWHEVVGWDKV